MPTHTVDQVHSIIEFQVKHMMVSKVKGRFDTYTATIEAEDLLDLTTASIQFTIDVESINTRNQERDNHLKSADFFDIEAYRNINFTSDKITGWDGIFQVSGDLTIKGITKPITFEVEYGGKGIDPTGKKVYGFGATARINREDFGLTWNAALESGGILVGKEIDINVELELNPA